MRLLLITYLISIAAGLCLLGLSVMWQAVVAAVHRWQGQRPVARRPGDVRGHRPQADERPGQARGHAA